MDDEDDDFELDDLFDCGMTPSGQCTKAGSEECDFECPLGALGQLDEEHMRRPA